MTCSYEVLNKCLLSPWWVNRCANEQSPRGLCGVVSISTSGQGGSDALDKHDDMFGEPTSLSFRLPPTFSP